MQGGSGGRGAARGWKARLAASSWPACGGVPAAGSPSGSVPGPSWLRRGLSGQLVARPVSTGNAHRREAAMRPAAAGRGRWEGARRPWARAARADAPGPLGAGCPGAASTVPALNKGPNVRLWGSWEDGRGPSLLDHSPYMNAHPWFRPAPARCREPGRWGLRSSRVRLIWEGRSSDWRSPRGLSTSRPCRLHPPA